jgi:DNA-binding IscR family transcriptional regulator
MRLKQDTQYALDLLGGMDDATGIVRLPLLAAHVGVPLLDARRIMDRLGNAELVAGRRGRKGGYTLGRPLAGITLREVLAAMQDPADSAAGEPSALVQNVTTFLEEGTAAILSAPVAQFLAEMAAA